MKNSVVITTYNGEKYIIEQLDSIKNQTLPPDEVIIRDDCSSDGTAKVIENYINCHKLINWNFRINEINKGFFVNFMDAIKECTGDVIYLADQDDIWDKHKIEMFTDFYSKNSEVMMVQSNMRFIDGNGASLLSKELYHGKKKNDKPSLLSTTDIFRFAGSGYTMSFRKEVADTVFNNKLDLKKDVFEFHDVLLGQVSAVMGKCYLVTDIVDAHRLHYENVTQRNGKSYLSDRTKQKQIELLKSKILRYKCMIEICKDEQKAMLIKSYIRFIENRLELIEKKRVKCLYYLIKHSENYASKKGIITDFLYAIGMEKLLLMVYQKL